jgi:hypothetical protein
MKTRQKINSLTNQELTEASNKFYSATEFAKYIDIPSNPRNCKIINSKLTSLNLTWKKRFKYEQITKECPVCGNKFTTQKGHPKEKTTCSHSCANTYFRSGPNNGSWNESNYRSTCFHYHGKKCIICGETRIVDVHHYDENHNNNKPENLVPLCPTHHQVYHSRYQNDIKQDVDSYINNYIQNVKK